LARVVALIAALQRLLLLPLQEKLAQRLRGYALSAKRHYLTLE
jgi:hypothetical protein